MNFGSNEFTQPMFIFETCWIRFKNMRSITARAARMSLNAQPGSPR